MPYFPKWVARAALVASAMVVSAGAHADWVTTRDDTGYRFSVEKNYYDTFRPENYIVTAGLKDDVFGNVFRVDAKPGFTISEITVTLTRVAILWGVGSSSWGIDNNWISFDSSGQKLSDNRFETTDFHFRQGEGSYLDSTVITTKFENTFAAIMSYHMFAQVNVNSDAWNPGGGTNHIDNFTFKVIANPVPEPEHYAMLLAGLGLVGAIARRRKVKQSA